MSFLSRRSAEWKDFIEHRREPSSLLKTRFDREHNRIPRRTDRNRNGKLVLFFSRLLGFWIDEAAKIITLADGKTLIVRRFDDRWISAVHGDMSYELDRQNGNLADASSTIKDSIATTIIGAGR